MQVPSPTTGGVEVPSSAPPRSSLYTNSTLTPDEHTRQHHPDLHPTTSQNSTPNQQAAQQAPHAPDSDGYTQPSPQTLNRKQCSGHTRRRVAKAAVHPLQKAPQATASPSLVNNQAHASQTPSSRPSKMPQDHPSSAHEQSNEHDSASTPTHTATPHADGLIGQVAEQTHPLSPDLQTLQPDERSRMSGIEHDEDH